MDAAKEEDGFVAVIANGTSAKRELGDFSF